jgi:hypothetical protein
MQHGVHLRKDCDWTIASSSVASFAWKAPRDEARTLSRVQSPEATAGGRP